jgi:arginine decarboxylase
MRNKQPILRPWTIQDSEELYMVRNWGKGYFRIGPEGHVHAMPRGFDKPGVDLYGLVEDPAERAGPAALLRFPTCWPTASARSARRSPAPLLTATRTLPAFPVKVNQQRHVVEEIVEFGNPFCLGLEAGSKPELMIALALHQNPESLILCNGVKDTEFIELAMLGVKLGKHVVVVADRLEEIKMTIDIAKRYDVKPRIGVRARLASRGAGRADRRPLEVRCRPTSCRCHRDPAQPQHARQPAALHFHRSRSPFPSRRRSASQPST